MRLLQVCTNFRQGGIQRHVLDLSNSLQSKGHKVFLSGSPGPWMSGDNDQHFLPLNLNKVSGEDTGNAVVRLRDAVTAAHHLRRFINRNAIQLVHAHESGPLIVAKLATIGKKIPVLVTYHGSSPERVKSFARISHLAADLVFTPSYRCANELKVLGRVPEEKLKVIGLGVQPAPEIPRERIEQHRKRLLGTNGKLLVVMIARLAYQKGIDILVDVVRAIKKQRQDIRFVLVGHGALESELREWTEKAEVESLLHYDGTTEEPYLYLKAADLFLLTSRWEALPITIAEAFQSGLPVVATDTGGVSELVSPAVGRVNAVGDVNGLAASILEICTDEKLRKNMAENASKLSREERFSLSRIHWIFERTYAEILGTLLAEK